MMKSSQLPSLGGETRDVTMFFSDVEGFTAFAESMSPSDLIALMNVYLSAMTDIIELHGGFVDKYIGDAIVGVFGAPVQDEDHACQAVLAALDCCERLTGLSKIAPAFKGHVLRHRIGLNSGEALVGNVGSGRRFNYTVIGDVVNLASRLEGANKYFGTSILASEATAALTGTAFKWREIDAVRVIGRAAPLRVYEPLAQSRKRDHGAVRVSANLCRGARLLAQTRFRLRRRAVRERRGRRSSFRAVPAQGKATHDVAAWSGLEANLPAAREIAGDGRTSINAIRRRR